MIEPIFKTMLCVAVLLGVLTSCSPAEDDANPKALRIGILPDQTPKKLRARYAGLFGHIKTATGAEVELVIPKSYTDLLRLFHERKVDMAYFGGVTFVKANREDNAVPLVMRDVDAQFRSYFLVSRDHPAQTIQDTKGASLGFGSRLSTSGHLMPRHFLQKGGINPEAFFGKVEFSGAHDRTARWVQEKKVDVGAVNAIIVDQMLGDGRLDKSRVRVLWETPPYPDYVWAVRASLGQNFRDRLRDAFLKLSADNAEHARILASVGAGTFLPARMADFGELSGIMRTLDLLS